MEAAFNHPNHATWECKYHVGSRRMSNARCGIFSATNSGLADTCHDVGRDEEVIRAYIRNQELADRQLAQFELKISAAQNPINRPNIP
jgi:hypothetical protein